MSESVSRVAIFSTESSAVRLRIDSNNNEAAGQSGGVARVEVFFLFCLLVDSCETIFSMFFNVISADLMLAKAASILSFIWAIVFLNTSSLV